MLGQNSDFIESRIFVGDTYIFIPKRRKRPPELSSHVSCYTWKLTRVSVRVQVFTSHTATVLSADVVTSCFTLGLRTHFSRYALCA